MKLDTQLFYAGALLVLRKTRPSPMETTLRAPGTRLFSARPTLPAAKEALFASGTTLSPAQPTLSPARTSSFSSDAASSGGGTTRFARGARWFSPGPIGWNARAVLKTACVAGSRSRARRFSTPQISFAALAAGEWQQPNTGASLGSMRCHRPSLQGLWVPVAAPGRQAGHNPGKKDHGTSSLEAP